MTLSNDRQCQSSTPTQWIPGAMIFVFPVAGMFTSGRQLRLRHVLGKDNIVLWYIIVHAHVCRPIFHPTSLKRGGVAQAISTCVSIRPTSSHVILDSFCRWAGNSQSPGNISL